MLPQAQRAFDLRGFGADGVFAGLKPAANRIEREMHGLASIKEKIHPGDDVYHRGGPDLRFAARAIHRFSPAKAPPQFQSEFRQFRIEVGLAKLFQQRRDFAEAFALFRRDAGIESNRAGGCRWEPFWQRLAGGGSKWVFVHATTLWEN